MEQSHVTPALVEGFIERWQGVSASELATAQSFVMDLGEDDAEHDESSVSRPTLKPSTQLPWPTTLPEQIKAMADVLSAANSPMDTEAIASHFKAKGRWRERLPMILENLEAIGRKKSINKQYSV
jgi:hypothetical protein